MHLVSPDCPPVNPLPRPGENLLVDKKTGRRCPAAPAGALLLTSAPFGWRGIIVERHRLPPAEMPEHSPETFSIDVAISTIPKVLNTPSPKVRQTRTLSKTTFVVWGITPLL